MSDEENIFRKESLNSLKSPEKLDDYIKVTRVRTWIVVAAIFSILIGFFVWALVSRIPVYATKKAISFVDSSSQVTTYVTTDEIDALKVNDKVKVGKYSGKISAIDSDPLTQDEIKGQIANEYIFDSLGLEEKWNFEVTIQIEGDLRFNKNQVYTVDIELREISPISYFLG